MGAKVVTANRLGDGAVVYLTAEGDWSVGLAEAAAVPDQEVNRLIAKAETDVAACLVVGPYAMAVAPTPSGPKPLSQRERIRAVGPSVRPDLCRRPAPRP